MHPSLERYTLASAFLIARLVASGSAPAFAADSFPCRPSQIGLAIVDDGGSGMMKGERLLVASNTSRRACSLDGFPRINVFDAAHGAIDVHREHGRMSPSDSAVSRVTIPAGGSAQATLRYTEGDVYPGGRCKRSSTLDVTLAHGTRSVETPFAATLCGTAAGPVITASELAPLP